MLKERDRNVVEQMCAAGMSLEALYKIFKTFDNPNVYVKRLGMLLQDIAQIRKEFDEEII